MYEGVVIKAYSSFYYVQANNKLFECKLRGRFKKEKKNVFAGDKVKMQALNENSGVIEEIIPRENLLIRPPIANVDQVLVVFAGRNPDPNLGLLDRILILAAHNQIKPVICLNKIDLMNIEGAEKIAREYIKIGYDVVLSSAKTGHGIDEIRNHLAGKISVLAGPSGVGKSTLLNEIQPGLGLKTGEVSAKIGRGKHTTRHVELLSLDVGGLVADTPGFSTLNVPEMEKEDLAALFPEIEPLALNCKFTSCFHHQEPQCRVKEAVATGEIPEFRYNHYLEFLAELKEKERKY